MSQHQEYLDAYNKDQPLPMGANSSKIHSLYIPFNDTDIMVGKIRVINESTSATVAGKVQVADSAFQRVMGLMGRRIGPDEGLLIVPCNGIHMFFMRMALDAVFLDRHNKVVRVVRELKPWRMVPYVRGAHAVLELYPGAAQGVSKSDQLELQRR